MALLVILDQLNIINITHPTRPKKPKPIEYLNQVRRPCRRTTQGF